jgi:hypothetical protein
MPKSRASIRVATATLSGWMLLESQRIAFEARIVYPKIDATFSDEATDGTPVDQWKALRALETFIDEQLRGNAQ